MPYLRNQQGQYLRNSNGSYLFSGALTSAPPTAITAAMPTFTADDTADTLFVNSTYPLSELEYRITDSGSIGPLASLSIAVGNVDRPMGYHQVRVKSAVDRLASEWARSVAFTFAAPPAGEGLPVTDTEYSYDGVTESQIATGPLYTATANFQNAKCRGLKRAANSGAGMRARTSAIPVTTEEDCFGFFDSSFFTVTPTGAWYGFYTNAAGNVYAIRTRETVVQLPVTVPSGTTLEVQLWDDSVRYIVGSTEVYRHPVPAELSHYLSGLIMLRANHAWRNSKFGAAVISPR